MVNRRLIPGWLVGMVLCFTLLMCSLGYMEAMKNSAPARSLYSRRTTGSRVAYRATSIACRRPVLNNRRRQIVSLNIVSAAEETPPEATTASSNVESKPVEAAATQEEEATERPSGFTRKQTVAIATGVISVGLGLLYIVGSESFGSRELKDPPSEALQP
ncbi:hypothetical protein AAMO2058_000970700 [Amorphochlora amoebiformis]